jgi:predicted secreted hydrolase
MRRRALLLSPLALIGCRETPSSALATLLQAPEASGFEPITAPVSLQFPRDHGPHWRQRLEWWYLTGWLEDSGGLSYGFQFTLFRLGLKPVPPTARVLAREHLLMGHFAVSDLAQQRYHAFERFARVDGQLGRIETEPLALRLDHWSLVQYGEAPEKFALRAEHDGIEMALDLHAAAPLLAQGDNGFSAKSASSASAYYSIPRLDAEGSIALDGRQRSVRGLGWFDREWSSSQLGREQIGWRWYALHLTDGSNLMLYALIDRNGAMDPYSKGVLQHADGGRTDLASTDFSITPTRWWRPDRTRRYPIDARLDIRPLGWTLNVRSSLDIQEFVGTFRYWEGAVEVRGSRSGRGYQELTS